MRDPEDVDSESAIDLDAQRAVEREDLLIRVRRFATLRAAENALTPSTLLVEEADSNRQLRVALELLSTRLAERGQAQPSVEENDRDHEELLDIDADLERLSDRVLAKLDGVSMPELRARMLADWPGMRTETSALLDVCMESEPYPHRYLRAVDFLISQLCTEKREEGWIVAVDPPNVSERVQRRCWATKPCAPEIEIEILETFEAAREEVRSIENPKQLLREMYQFKQDIAQFFFCPQILRSIIGYNLEMRTRFRLDQEQQRATDAHFDLLMGLGRPTGGETTAADQEQVPESPLENPGALAVQDAVGQRLRGEELGDGPAWEIARALDLSLLERSESDVFLHESGDALLRTVRMTVVVCHLARKLDEFAEDLEELGIDPARVSTWALRLSLDLQREIDALLRENAYDGAQELTQIKARLLGIRDRSASRSGASSTETDIQAGAREFAASLRRRSARRRAARRRRGRARAFPGRLVFGGATAMASLLGLQLLFGDSIGIDELSSTQLHALSPILESGYRGEGQGEAVFIGTVSREWVRMSASNRVESADELIRKLGLQGVDELLLYDHKRALQGHYVGARWRHLATGSAKLANGS